MGLLNQVLVDVPNLLLLLKEVVEVFHSRREKFDFPGCLNVVLAKARKSVQFMLEIMVL